MELFLAFRATTSEMLGSDKSVDVAFYTLGHDNTSQLPELKIKI